MNQNETRALVESICYILSPRLGDTDKIMSRYAELQAAPDAGPWITEDIGCECGHQWTSVHPACQEVECPSCHAMTKTAFLDVLLRQADGGEVRGGGVAAPLDPGTSSFTPQAAPSGEEAQELGLRKNWLANFTEYVASQRIADLEEEKHNLNKKLDEQEYRYEREIAALRAKLAEAQSEGWLPSSPIRRGVESARDAIAVLRTERDELKRDLNSAVDSMAEAGYLDEEVAIWKGVTMLAEVRDEQAQRIADLEEEKHNLDKKIEAQAQRIADLEQDREAYMAQNARVEQKLAEAEQEAEKWRGEYLDAAKDAADIAFVAHLQGAEAARDAIAVYRNALGILADNFSHAGTPPQPWRDMIDSWHYIARNALGGEQ